jgi:hypothetical protein
MSLLRDIQDAAITTDQPLASVLRKARVLAARLGNEPLRQWISHELNGYPPKATLPPYRALRQVPVRGTFAGPFRQATNLPVPPLAFPEALRDGELFTFSFDQPVAAYEEMLRADPGDFHAPWPADALAALRPSTGDMACVSAWRVLTRGDVVGVVDGVRNRLLEFVLELEREAPDAGEALPSELPVSTERVTQIFHTTIYAGAATVSDQSIHVQGTTGNIAGGQGNTARQGDVLIGQQTTDLAPLLERLGAAVAELPPGGEAETTLGLVEALRKESAAEQPRQERMLGLLKGISALAASAGTAGAAVIDAAQAIHRALGG